MKEILQIILGGTMAFAFYCVVLVIAWGIPILLVVWAIKQFFL